MKKIFLLIFFTIIGFTINSCSNSSDSNPEIGGTISFKVDGVQKTFNDIYVSENVYNSGTSDEYTELSVLTMPQNASEHMEFYLYKNRLEDIVSVFYTVDDVEWVRVGTFAIQLTSNGNNNKLIGTFSGQMSDNEIQPQNYINITEGTFNIQY